MKLPKKQRIFCSVCGRHTEHEVEIAKRRPRRKLAIGQRRFKRKLAGYGSFPKSKPDYEKAVKKVDLRFKCLVCGKKHTKGKGFRAKKFQIVKI